MKESKHSHGDGGGGGHGQVGVLAFWGGETERRGFEGDE
jgi:hypothetical protein